MGTKAFGDQHIATLVQHGRVLGSQFCPTQIGGAQGLQALRAMLNTIHGIDAAVEDNLSSDFDASSGRRVVAMVVATIDSTIAQVVRFGKVWKREVRCCILYTNVGIVHLSFCSTKKSYL